VVSATLSSSASFFVPTRKMCHPSPVIPFASSSTVKVSVGTAAICTLYFAVEAGHSPVAS
jgi:hypothetical protein